MIETERLILRPYTLDDYEPYCLMVADPELDFPSQQTVSREDAWHRVMRYAGHWSFFGYGNFAVTEKVTGAYIGETGLADYHRAMGEGFDGFDEAAWFIAAGCHGQGYGFEAASAAHDWYGSRTARQRTVCMIDPGNTPSINLAEKLGYKVFREGSYKDNPVIMFERLAGRS